MATSDPATVRMLERARDFLDANYDLPLNMRTTAQVAGFSEFHFIRVFKATYGITPYQYLRRRRIAHARALLATHELSVTAICFAVGFESPSAFATVFGREVGYSPRSYRARLFGGITLPPPFVPLCFRRMYAVSHGAGR